MDEALAASTGQLRYPRNGHVLYLEVGECVAGPTCVWQQRDEAEGPDARFGALTTVPAVAGRCLRFDGELQHAVPRPADVWLSSFVVNQPSTPPEAFVRSSAIRTRACHACSDACNEACTAHVHYPRQVRSVVLFNTWAEQDAPPLDVHREPADAVTALEVTDPERVRCRERHEWEEAATAQLEGGERTRMKLWLLGDETRRLQPSRTVALDVPSATLAALTETHTVTSMV